MKLYQRSYAYDPGTNLQQMSSSSSVAPRRMMVSSRSNRSIDEPLYSSLDLEQKRDLDASIDTFFDVHGNQKQTGSPALMNRWDCSNQIQNTKQLVSDGSRTLEYSVYAKSGSRSRKILERQDALGNVYHIRETVYLEELEYQTAWQGDNLVYDGEDVTDAESGEVVSPIEASHTLRIREGHRQVGERKVFTVKAGQAVDEAETLFSLDNRIDSCQARLDPSGELKSFLSYAPYGQTTQSFGETLDQRYRYSGQEEEDSGLYAYGFRSYLPSCYRWMSPDPAGMSGSGLNRYAMVDGNPVTMRDEMGLMFEWLTGGNKEEDEEDEQPGGSKNLSKAVTHSSEEEFWHIHNYLFRHVGSEVTRMISNYLFGGMIAVTSPKEYITHIRSHGLSAGYYIVGRKYTIKPELSIDVSKTAAVMTGVIDYARAVIPYAPNRYDDRLASGNKSPVGIPGYRYDYFFNMMARTKLSVDPNANLPISHLYSYVYGKDNVMNGRCEDHALLVAQYIHHKVKGYKPYIIAFEYRDGTKKQMIRKGFKLDHALVAAIPANDPISNSLGMNSKQHFEFSFFQKHHAILVDAWDKIAYAATHPDAHRMLAITGHAASGAGTFVGFMSSSQYKAFKQHTVFSMVAFPSWKMAGMRQAKEAAPVKEPALEWSHDI